MAEYIEREKAFNAVLKLVPKVDDDGYCWVIRGDAATAIDNITAADVRPVRRGKWKISEHEYIDCSVCGYAFYTGFDTTAEAKEYIESGYTPNFCPNCGADMREES